MRSQYKFAIRTAQGGRDENQDFSACEQYDNRLVAIVCDGMGGTQGGRMAAALATETVLDIIEANLGDHPMTDQFVRNAIDQANRVVWQQAGLSPDYQHMGTTLAIAAIESGNAIIAHVGDTRVYQVRAGQIIFRTEDHSKAHQLVHAGKMTEEEARLSPAVNVITRVIGVLPAVQTDLKNLAVTADDVLLLCTDGIWAILGDEKILACLYSSADVEIIAEKLIREADFIGSQSIRQHDNMTVAVIHIGHAASFSFYKRINWHLFIYVLICLLVFSLIILLK